MPDQRPSHRDRRRSKPGRGSSRDEPARRSGPPRSPRTEPSEGPRATPSPVPRWAAEEVRATARPGRGEGAVRDLERAVELLDGGDEDAAEAAAAAAGQAKDSAPRSGTVREVLGIALYRSGRYREALRELQAYRRMTNRLDQNHLIADAHRALGAPEKAVQAARDALEAPIPDESRAEAAIVGAEALGDLGRFGEALALLRSFPTSADVARPFDLRLWYAAGDILERAQRMGEAAEEFRRVVRFDPGAFDASDRLAHLTGQ